MELTRRDALAALAAAGAAGGAAVLPLSAPTSERVFADQERERLVALARVLYPSAVEGIEAFVGTYVAGRVRDRPAYADGMRAALSELDERAREWHDAAWLDLAPGERHELLEAMGADGADADPDGLANERVRYYLVDELLYALYASPTGGELVGIENPIGYPGGLASYQRPAPGRDGDRVTDADGTGEGEDG